MRNPRVGHDGRVSGPYIASPAQPAARSVPTPVVRNGYVSVQVNVDANGLNILGDAANEPSMAISAIDPNTIVIGWRQFDTILSDFRQAGWANSHDGGNSWAFHGVLRPGEFRTDPVLAANADGDIYYYSLLAPGSAFYTCQMFKSVDGGDSWLPEVQAFGGDKQWMTIDRTGGPGQGNIYGAWTSYVTNYYPFAFTRSLDGGFSFLGPYRLPSTADVIWGSMSVAPDGALYICAADQPGGQLALPRLLKSVNAAIPSAAPTFIDYDIHATESGEATLWISNGSQPNPEGLLGQAWVVVDASDGPTRGNIYWLASARYGYLSDEWGLVLDLADVVFRRSTDGGETWSGFKRINDDPVVNPFSVDPIEFQWFGAIDVAPDGRTDVAWYDTRNSDPNDASGPYYSELYYAYSYDAGETWSRNIPASPTFNHSLGYPVQQKIGDYTHMVSDHAAAALAYAATFNGEQDVYFVRLGDGNQNGQHDGIDIATGLTPDTNDDDVPDDCQVIREGPWLRLPLINGGAELHGTYAWRNAVMYAAVPSASAPEGSWCFETTQVWFDGDPNARMRQSIELGELAGAFDWLRVSGVVSQAPGSAFDPSSGRSFVYVATPIATIEDAEGGVISEHAAAQTASSAWSAFELDFDVSWLPALHDAQRVTLRLDGHWAELPGLIPADVQPGWVTTWPAWSRYDGLKLRVFAPIGCPGDADCSGVIDFFDIDPFVAKLGCPGAGANCDDACPWRDADVDQDGDVDFFDIDPFVALLGTTCP